MYLLEPGYSLGPVPDCLILEASRQPRLVPKPERMSSDGGESAGGGKVPATCSPLGDSKLDTLRGDQLSGLTSRDVRTLDPVKGITLGETGEGDRAIKTMGWGRKRASWVADQSTSEESAE